MIDIISAHDGLDLGVLNTQTPRATNILSVQLGDLEYAKTFGIDLKYFLSEEFLVENESFKSYLVETLANFGISVAELRDVVENLYHRYIFNLSPEQQSTGLIAR